MKKILARVRFWFEFPKESVLCVWNMAHKGGVKIIRGHARAKRVEIDAYGYSVEIFSVMYINLDTTEVTQRRGVAIEMNDGSPDET